MPCLARAGKRRKSMNRQAFETKYKTETINGLRIFYREAGPKDAPSILLLHGFPTSSHMFRNLIPRLSDRYHVIAPDYPGFGQSAMPSVAEFEYTFANLANVMQQFVHKIGLKSYTLYLMDYGAPVGFRLATANPDRVDGLIIQNGNAYVEGLREFWKPLRAYWNAQTPENRAVLTKFLDISATEWQYTHGTRDKANISPDNWIIDQHYLDRPGNREIQLALFLSYGSNPPLYPEWQEYMRTYQPPALLVWGKGDFIFPEEGAHPYKRDLNHVDFNILDTGHFALEEDGAFIAQKIRDFMQQTTATALTTD
jgi:pimeloyl-ACP methyl ester carboxylesterase